MMNHPGSGGGSSINTSWSDHHHHSTNAQGFDDMYEGFEELFSSSSTLNNSSSLLYNLSVILKEKVQQLQSIVAMTITSPAHHNTAAFSSAGSLIHEIIGAASSMLALVSPVITPGNELDHQLILQNNNSSSKAAAAVDARGNNKRRISMINMQNSTTTTTATTRADDHVIELDAADLLAKYSHFCHVCGKGFKRDANLRMHMRSHGDEYKTNAALANPTKKNKNCISDVTTTATNGQKYCYSCPEMGCRWNKNHAKFQPLKSMVCAKNHYKRSHCPKMYVCNRCCRKNFSVLSDLRTHEKHCGDDHRWRCSCGTAFSRKDKLIGHVNLFAGHAPAPPLDKYCSSSSQVVLQGN